MPNHAGVCVFIWETGCGNLPFGREPTRLPRIPGNRYCKFRKTDQPLELGIGVKPCVRQFVV